MCNHVWLAMCSNATTHNCNDHYNIYARVRTTVIQHGNAMFMWTLLRTVAIAFRRICWTTGWAVAGSNDPSGKYMYDFTTWKATHMYFLIHIVRQITGIDYFSICINFSICSVIFELIYIVNTMLFITRLFTTSNLSWRYLFINCR